MKTEESVSKAAITTGLFALVMLLTFALSAQSDVQRTVNGNLRITLIQPTVVTAGDNPFEVSIEGSDGQVINDVDVSVSFVMSAWPIKRIPETRKDLTLRSAGEGRYKATWNVSLRGPWLTTVIVKKNGTRIGRKKFVLIAY